ncbi:50S ribosomal protein L25 [candidate division WWE3 bacterium]|nr:50S ribosomal protein L25 [candidate division WWE3 bacterium]
MQLIAEKREQFGKKAKRIRQDRKVPAVIFGPDIDSIPITIDNNEFVRIYREAGETTLVDIAVEGVKEPYKVLIKELQLNPVNYSVLHASFYKVNLKEKTTADIPVVIEGDQEIDLVKKGEALVLTQLNEITVSALPMNLPREFVLDVSGFEEIGDSLTVADLEFDEDKVEVVEHGTEDIVAVLDYATIEEEEEEEALTEEELIEGLEATEEREEGEEGAVEGGEGAAASEDAPADSESSAE